LLVELVNEGNPMIQKTGAALVKGVLAKYAASEAESELLGEEGL
jgi:hypothetical protein